MPLLLFVYLFADPLLAFLHQIFDPSWISHIRPVAWREGSGITVKNIHAQNQWKATKVGSCAKMESIDDPTTRTKMPPKKYSPAITRTCLQLIPFIKKENYFWLNWSWADLFGFIVNINLYLQKKRIPAESGQFRIIQWIWLIGVRDPGSEGFYRQRYW